MTGIAGGFNAGAEAEGARPERAAAVVVVVGPLDLVSAPDLRRRIRAELEAGGRDIVVDTSAVDFIDATGIGVLIGGANAARAAGGGLVLRAPSPAVSWLLDILGLDDTFGLTPGRPQRTARRRHLASARLAHRRPGSFRREAHR